MPVEIVTLTPKPVEQTGEFVGTIKSRKSTTVQPQAEGIITHIAVKSGDRVSPGAVILEIDAGPQRSAVAVLEGIHAAREADATFAKQQAARAKTMLDVGAGSQQEYDQAVAQQKAAEAQLKAVEDQIRQQQAELAGTGAHFEGDFTRAQQRWQRPGQPAVVAHELVNQPQVAPVVQGVRVIRRQGVENLGLKRTLHGSRGGLPDRGRVSRVPDEL